MTVSANVAPDTTELGAPSMAMRESAAGCTVVCFDATSGPPAFTVTVRVVGLYHVTLIVFWPASAAARSTEVDVV